MGLGRNAALCALVHASSCACACACACVCARARPLNGGRGRQVKDPFLLISSWKGCEKALHAKDAELAAKGEELEALRREIERLAESKDRLDRTKYFYDLQTVQERFRGQIEDLEGEVREGQAAVKDVRNKCAPPARAPPSSAMPPRPHRRRRERALRPAGPAAAVAAAVARAGVGPVAGLQQAADSGLGRIAC